MTPERPTILPKRPFFSSGPCAKRPGWSTNGLERAFLGRSHRAPEAVRRLRAVIDRSRGILGIPADWRVGIVPGSDTGAVEMALWSLIRDDRAVDVLAFESFSASWAADLAGQLRPTAGVRVLDAPYGGLPDLAAVDWSRDVVFAWNGTTSGVRIPDGVWIADDRAGLAICDATSAAFAMELPWRKLDVVTWSWQKALGGEAAHGMLALSPRAAARLVDEPADRALPKLFRLTAGGRLLDGVFAGDVINTVSMLCVEDALDGLAWAEAVGGLSALIARSRANLAAVADWQQGSRWARFLAQDPATRSSTAICLAFRDGAFGADADLRRIARDAARTLEQAGAGFDLAAYRDAPPGFRIWGGATVETADIEHLLPWLDWAVAGAATASA